MQANTVGWDVKFDPQPIFSEAREAKRQFSLPKPEEHWVGTVHATGIRDCCCLQSKENVTQCVCVCVCVYVLCVCVCVYVLCVCVCVCVCVGFVCVRVGFVCVCVCVSVREREEKATTQFLLDRLSTAVDRRQAVSGSTQADTYMQTQTAGCDLVLPKRSPCSALFNVFCFHTD